MEKKENITVEEAAKVNAGVAVDIALENEVTQKLVDEETRELNNNPRNDK